MNENEPDVALGPRALRALLDAQYAAEIANHPLLNGLVRNQLWNRVICDPRQARKYAPAPAGRWLQPSGRE